MRYELYYWPSIQGRGKAAVKRMAHPASTSALHTVPAAIAGQRWLEPANLRHAAAVLGGSNQWPSPDRACNGAGAADGPKYRSSS